MPTLKTRMIFISHAWSYSKHYWKLVNWFNEEPRFSWKNCSVPSHNQLPNENLAEGLTRQISPAQVVIILAGMYATEKNSEWIDYEISEAIRMNKIIIGVAPWGQERVPVQVQNASTCDVVRWNKASIIQAIRTWV